MESKCVPIVDLILTGVQHKMDESDIVSKFLRQKKLAAIVPSIVTFLLLLHVAGVNVLSQGTAIGFTTFVLISLIAAALLRNKFVTVEAIGILCPKCKKPMHSKILKCEICGTEIKMGEEDK